MKKVVSFLSVMLVFLVVGVAWGVPVIKQLPFSVTTNLSPATYTFKFSLWNALSGGSKVWEEEKSVKMTSKTLRTNLGTVVANSLDAVDFSQQLWVQVEQNDGGVYTVIGTRTKLSLAPYAIWSETSEATGPHTHASADITSGTLNNGHFSAYSDLTAEGYLDNNAGTDLLTRAQSDSRYVQGAETDPQVGTLTANLWCASNAGGTAIDCTNPAPALASHSHWGANWSGSSSFYGLKVNNSSTGDGIRAYSSSTQHYDAAVYAINTAATGNGSGVYGNSAYGSGVYGNSTSGKGVTAVSSGKGLGAPALYVDNTDTTATEPAGIAIWAKNHSGDATIVTQNTGAGDVFRAFNKVGNGFIFKVTGTGRVVTTAVQITGGGDLSERFEIRKPQLDLELQPGMVVSIDPENPGKLVVSRKAYDKTVAGIISGANGISSGMVMGQEGSIVDGTQSVALTGRVYVIADASKKAIKPGDLLTTSDKAGHAMKVSNHTKAQGAIIGKAMTGLDKGTGLVLVLVSLQ